MNYHYTKIDNLVFNDKSMYFRTPLTTVFTRATTFSDKYLYYHCQPTIDNKPDPDIKKLGKFVKISRHSSNDYDYSVYEFEFGTVKCKQDGRTDGNIYLVGIPDSDEGMTPLDNMLYYGWPVFYKKN